MKNKAKMTAFGMVALFALSAANPVFSHDSDSCPTHKKSAQKKTTCKPAHKPAPKPIVVNTCNPCAIPAPVPQPIVVNTCNPCAVIPPSVSYHPVLSGQFHEQLLPKDADGNILGLLDISGKSAKVGVDWTNATNDMFTWGTHTTKNNSATVVEIRY